MSASASAYDDLLKRNIGKEISYFGGFQIKPNFDFSKVPVESFPQRGCISDIVDLGTNIMIRQKIEAIGVWSGLVMMIQLINESGKRFSVKPVDKDLELDCFIDSERYVIRGKMLIQRFWDSFNTEVPAALTYRLLAPLELSGGLWECWTFLEMSSNIVFGTIQDIKAKYPPSRTLIINMGPNILKVFNDYPRCPIPNVSGGDKKLVIEKLEQLFLHGYHGHCRVSRSFDTNSVALYSPDGNWLMSSTGSWAKESSLSVAEMKMRTLILLQHDRAYPPKSFYATFGSSTYVRTQMIMGILFANPNKSFSFDEIEVLPPEGSIRDHFAGHHVGDLIMLGLNFLGKYSSEFLEVLIPAQGVLNIDEFLEKSKEKYKSSIACCLFVVSELRDHPQGVSDAFVKELSGEFYPLVKFLLKHRFNITFLGGNSTWVL